LPGSAPAEKRMKLMVVEDEPDLLRLFTLVIAGWDLPIDVTPAGNGFEALLRMGRDCPDLLVTDLNMPGMDGFKMISSLRSVGAAFDDMDIVVVTGLSATEIDHRGGLPDGVRIFHKPVPFDEIEVLVRERLLALGATA
jgi:CheY-like chemotaxis protein